MKMVLEVPTFVRLTGTDPELAEMAILSATVWVPAESLLAVTSANPISIFLSR